MCTIIDKLFITKAEAYKAARIPVIAKRDIKVKKIFNFNMATGKLYSPYTKVKYNEDCIHNVKRFTHEVMTAKKAYNYLGMKTYAPKGFFIAIHEGMHSFKKTKDAKDIIDERLEFIKKKNKNLQQVIIQCTIPKGSMYFQNRIEIVSNQLFVPRWIVSQESKCVFNTSDDWELIH